VGRSYVPMFQRQRGMVSDRCDVGLLLTGPGGVASESHWLPSSGTFPFWASRRVGGGPVEQAPKRELHPRPLASSNLTIAGDDDVRKINILIEEYAPALDFHTEFGPPVPRFGRLGDPQTRANAPLPKKRPRTEPNEEIIMAPPGLSRPSRNPYPIEDRLDALTLPALTHLPRVAAPHSQDCALRNLVLGSKSNLRIWDRPDVKTVFAL
jgi:hypothetical protein